MFSVRVIAFYLPQYYPIPENDSWWGPGFTEWTNVAKARPLFPGHPQPRLPGELGFYDLRLQETRLQQAELARTYGVEGFAYWHYWFGDGRTILDRPFQEVLDSGQPDLPFCLAWANASWTGVWHGNPGRVLVEQHYPGREDIKRHFFSVLPAFRDSRYIRVRDCPLFLVHRPHNLPNARMFAEVWRGLAKESGLAGLYLVGQGFDFDPRPSGFDAAFDQPRWLDPAALRRSPIAAISGLLNRGAGIGGPTIVPYRAFVRAYSRRAEKRWSTHPGVMPNWDNTPRSGRRGTVFTGSNPYDFEEHARDVFRGERHRPPGERLVFLKSWNEWAEGNYVEPDRMWGREWLVALRRALEMRNI